MKEVVVLSPEDYAAYNRFVLIHPRALFFYSLYFKQLLEKEFKLISYYMILKIDKTIAGVLPFFVKENSKYGNVLNSLPFFGSNGGILIDKHYDTDENRQLLIDSLLDYMERHACISAVIITSPFEKNLDIYEHYFRPDFIDSRVGQITVLQKDNFRQFNKMRRRAITKAQKCGVKVRITETATSDELDRCYKLYLENIERLKGILKPYSFMERINTEPFSKLILAERNDEIIAGLFSLYWNDTVEYYLPFFDESQKNCQAMSLSIYEGMNNAYRNGFKYWNFEGTWLNQEGVYNFKKSFGAVDKSYYYFVKVNREMEYFAKLGREQLLREYQYFYVLPFNAFQGYKMTNISSLSAGPTMEISK